MYAQNAAYNIYGKIYDENKKPLEFATVVFREGKVGATTNEKGIFRLSINANPEDVLIVSFLGYKNKQVSIRDFLNLPNGTICLSPDVFILDEVIAGELNLEKKLSAKSLFKKARKTFDKNLPPYNYIAKAYYKEKIKYNNKYVLFAQSIGYALNMHLRPNTAYMTKYKFIYKNTKLANIDTLWRESIKKKYDRISDCFLSGSANVNQYLRLTKYGVLSNKWNNYEYELDSVYYKHGRKIYRINFKGKETGCVDFYADNLRIFQMNYDTSNFPTNPFNKYLTANIAIQFHYFNNNVFLSKMTSSYIFEDNTHFNSFEILSQKFSGFKTDRAEYWGAVQNAYNPTIFYDPKEWQNLKIEDDIEIEVIKKDLAPNTTLETQYIKNSGSRLDLTFPITEYEVHFLKKMKQIESAFLE
ncbi:MAG: carboxypeptidase-like regulatory domain-containing protein [Lachnospirales bacterium]